MVCSLHCLSENTICHEQPSFCFEGQGWVGGGGAGEEEEGSMQFKATVPFLNRYIFQNKPSQKAEESRQGCFNFSE